MKNPKDILTTIFGVLAAVALAVNGYLNSMPPGASIDWLSFILAAALAVIGFFTGRNADGSKKVIQ